MLVVWGWFPGGVVSLLMAHLCTEQQWIENRMSLSVNYFDNSNEICYHIAVWVLLHGVYCMMPCFIVCDNVQQAKPVCVSQATLAMLAPRYLTMGPGGWLKNASISSYNSISYKNHIFKCMLKIFCVEFQRYPLKFHSKYLTHTLKDVCFLRFEKLRAFTFRTFLNHLWLYWHDSEWCS